MNTQASSPNRQRYSGPELAELLERVVTEHGPSASIAAVNRIRSGGIAGFFCREEFEVLVDGDPTGRPVEGAMDHEPPASSSDRGERVPERPSGSGGGEEEKRPGGAGRALQDGWEDDEDTYDPERDARFKRLLEQRLAELQIVDSVDVAGPAEPVEAIDRRPAAERRLDAIDLVDRRDRPEVEVDVRDDRGRSDEPDGSDEPVVVDESTVETERRGGETPPPGGSVRVVASEALHVRRLDGEQVDHLAGRPTAPRADVGPGDPIPVEGVPVDRHPMAGDDEPGRAAHDDWSPEAGGTDRADDDTTPTDDAPEERLVPPHPPSPLWHRIDRTNRELDAFLPMPAARNVIVGPLAAAIPVIRAHQGGYGLGPSDVVVLTARSTATIDAQWTLVRSSAQLLATAVASNPSPTVLVIDAPTAIPSWVGPLVNRLSGEAGIGLVRFVVPGLPDDDGLARCRTGGGGRPYVIDLTARVPPGTVLDLLDDGHPIATVGGADVTGELVVAMRDRTTDA